MGDVLCSIQEDHSSIQPSVKPNTTITRIESIPWFVVYDKIVVSEPNLMLSQRLKRSIDLSYNEEDRNTTRLFVFRRYTICLILMYVQFWYLVVLAKTANFKISVINMIKIMWCLISDIYFFPYRLVPLLLSGHPAYVYWFKMLTIPSNWSHIR